MRIKYPPLIDLDVALTGHHNEGRLVVIEAKLGKKDAALILSTEEARNLKKALEDALFELAKKGIG
jgi:hypothetical protein